MEEKKRRKGIVIMGQLVGLVKPLLPVDVPGCPSWGSGVSVRNFPYNSRGLWIACMDSSH